MIVLFVLWSKTSIIRRYTEGKLVLRRKVKQAETTARPPHILLYLCLLIPAMAQRVFIKYFFPSLLNKALSTTTNLKLCQNMGFFYVPVNSKTSQARPPSPPPIPEQTPGHLTFLMLAV